MVLLDPVFYPQVLGSVSHSVNYCFLLSQYLISYVYATTQPPRSRLFKHTVAVLPFLLYVRVVSAFFML